jgi:hypothetical protein
MPEHDTFDLDALFRELERDIADITHAPGAAEAVRGARTRRLHRWGAVAAAAAAVVVVGVGVSVVPRGHEPGVASTDRPKPPYGDLTAAALSDATSGWVGPWDHQPGGLLDDPPASAACWVSAVAGSDAYAENRGQNTYTAGGGVSAELVGLAYGSEAHGATGYADLTRALGRCGQEPDATFAYPDGTEVTHTTGPGEGSTKLEVWTVDAGQFILLFETSGTLDSPTASTVAQVSDVLAGALDGNQAFNDPAAPPRSLLRDYVMVEPDDLMPALEGWATPWTPDLGRGGNTPTLPCEGHDDHDWMGYASAGGIATQEGGNGEYFFSRYVTSEATQEAEARLVDELGGCGTPFAFHTVRSAAGNEVQVGVRAGEQVVWITDGGTDDVAYLRIPIDTPPPDSVSAKVADVMHDVMTRSAATNN